MAVKRFYGRKHFLTLSAMIFGRWLSYITVMMGLSLILVDVTNPSLLYYLHDSLAKTNPVAVALAVCIILLFVYPPDKNKKSIMVLSMVLLCILLSIFDFGLNFLFHDQVLSLYQYVLAHIGAGQFDLMGNNSILTFFLFVIANLYRINKRYHAYQLLILFGLSAPFTAAVGYFFDAKPLYFDMSVSTVIICFMVAVTGLAMSANKGAIRLFLAPNLVGIVARTQYVLSLLFCLVASITLPRLLADASFFSAYEIFVTLTTIFISILIYVSTVVLGEAEKKKRQAEKEMKRLLLTDPLTGIYNRRGFDQELEKAINYQSRYGGNISILILDLDYFKSVNDRFGHDVGDLFLKTVAAILRRTIRKSDVLCRFGGEEFLILLPNSSEEKAKLVAEKLRRAVEEKNFGDLCGEDYHQTISIGGTTVYPLVPNIESSLRKADKRLYEAKHNGRNCSVVH